MKRINQPNAINRQHPALTLVEDLPQHLVTVPVFSDFRTGCMSLQNSIGEKRFGRNAGTSHLGSPGVPMMNFALIQFLHWWALTVRKWLVGRPLVPSPEVMMGVELNRLVLQKRTTHTHFQ